MMIKSLLYTSISFVGSEYKVVLTDDQFPILYLEFACHGNESSLSYCMNKTHYDDNDQCLDEAVHITCESETLVYYHVCNSMYDDNYTFRKMFSKWSYSISWYWISQRGTNMC